MEGTPPPPWAVQSIVANIARQAPGCIDRAFGAEAAQLLKIIAASPAEQEAWADRISAGSRLAEPWRTSLQRFGSFPEVQAEQRARVHHDYFMPALHTAASLRLASELGIALCFDIHVQNGSVARGEGMVHGRRVVATWGLTDTPAVVAS